MIAVDTVLDEPIVVGVVCRPTNQCPNTALCVERCVVLGLKLPEGKSVGLPHRDHSKVVFNHFAHFLLTELEHVIVLISHLGNHLPLQERERRAVQIGFRNQLEDCR